MIAHRYAAQFINDFYYRIQRLKGPALILFGFSTAAIALNTLIYQFPGNSFVRFNALPVMVFLFINLALLLPMLGIKIITKKIVLECLLFFLVCVLIILGATAIQYTPFRPIDAHILAWEKAMHMNLLPMVIWTNHHPLIHLGLAQIYDLLELEMIAFPLYAIALKQYDYLHEYFFLVLTTACIGFIFYYFFPTTGPASNLPASHFAPEQLATGQKFWQIHHYQQPTTTLGGMIVMPSFHVIWAWLNVYLIRFQPLYCALFAIINVLLTFACVLLGWHYSLDIIGSFIILAIAFYIYKKPLSSRKQSEPDCFQQ